MQDPTSLQQEKMINEQVQILIQQKQQQQKRNTLSYKNQSIWNQANYQPKTTHEPNKHNFTIYADKLLVHLVIQEEFNFQKISQIMKYTFDYQPTKTYTQQSCRQRWYEMHRDRLIQPQIKQKQMQNKRIKSIMSFNDPFLLYNIDEKLHKMERDNNNRQEKMRSSSSNSKLMSQQQHQQQPKQQQEQPTYIQIKYDGYSIFKDSIRKIDNIQKYNQLQQHMKHALKKASQSVQLQKPMLYTPYYDRLQQFEVLQQELTVEKMQQMMSHPIEMEFMQRELKVLDLNQRYYQSRIKKQVEKKVKKEKIKNQQQFQIQQDWDQYESD